MANSDWGHPDGGNSDDGAAETHLSARGDRKGSTVPESGRASNQPGGGEGADVGGGRGLVLTPGPRRAPRPILVPPAPVECFDILHPAVPAGLEGLTILHLSDLHVHRRRPYPPTIRRLLAALPDLRPDLVCLTGDYADLPGGEDSALQALSAVVASCRSRLGVFGVFGNHDHPELRSAARRVPGVTWLEGRADIDTGAGVLTLVGSSYPEDVVSAASGVPRGGFVVGLAHDPTSVYAAEAVGLSFVMAGHTHAGQLRLSPGLVLHTSCDLPGTLSSGLLRLGGTLMAVSRGLGEAVLDLRLNCPPQAPLYTLRGGPLSGDGRSLRVVQPW